MAEERREIDITVKIVCDGFGADVTARCLVEHIPGLIRKLREAGVTPANSPYVWPANQAGERVNGAGGAAQPQPIDAPRCPVHGTVMKPSSKGGGYFCPKKNADGNFCKERAA